MNNKNIDGCPGGYDKAKGGGRGKVEAFLERKCKRKKMKNLPPKFWSATRNILAAQQKFQTGWGGGIFLIR